MDSQENKELQCIKAENEHLEKLLWKVLHVAEEWVPNKTRDHNVLGKARAYLTRNKTV